MGPVNARKEQKVRTVVKVNVNRKKVWFGVCRHYIVDWTLRERDLLLYCVYKMAENITVLKFEGKDYQQWKFQMKCALKAKGVYEIASGQLQKPAADTQEVKNWKKNDAIACF